MQQPLTRADVVGFLETVQEAGPVAEDLGINFGGVDMETIEKLFKFVERAEPLFKRFSDQWMRVSGAGRGANALGDDGGFIDTGEVQDGPSPPARSGKVQPAQEPAQERRNLGDVEPIRIYQLLLKALNTLPGETTVAEALAQAREKKTMILMLIAQAVEELLKPEGNNGSD